MIVSDLWWIYPKDTALLDSVDAKILKPNWICGTGACSSQGSELFVLNNVIPSCFSTKLSDYFILSSPIMGELFDQQRKQSTYEMVWETRRSFMMPER